MDVGVQKIEVDPNMSSPLHPLFTQKINQPMKSRNKFLACLGGPCQPSKEAGDATKLRLQLATFPFNPRPGKLGDVASSDIKTEMQNVETYFSRIKKSMILLKAAFVSICLKCIYCDNVL